MIVKSGQSRPELPETISTSDSVDDTPVQPYRFELNPVELARMLLNRRKLIAVGTLAAMVMTAGYLFFQPNLYTSQAIILPSGETGGIAALTGLMGVGDPYSGVDENSSLLYPVILRSNLIVDGVLEKEYAFSHKGKPMRLKLAEYFGMEDPDRLRRALHDVTFVDADNFTGEIRMGVETKYPALSQEVLKGYLAALEDFNLNKRRSSARESERYLARQLDITEVELHAAEDNLESFQLVNQDWAITGSPEVLKELGRLQREVNTRTATYAILNQQYETARLDAQKDVPIVSILDQPTLPTMKSGPFRRNMILLSGILSCGLIIFVLIVRHLIRQTMLDADRDEVDSLRHEIDRLFPRTTRIVNRLKATINDKLPVAGD